MADELPEDERLARFHRQNALVEEAMRLVLRDVKLLHKRAGQPLVTWENGQIVLIPADEIVIDELALKLTPWLGCGFVGDTTKFAVGIADAATRSVCVVAGRLIVRF